LFVAKVTHIAAVAAAFSLMLYELERYGAVTTATGIIKLSSVNVLDVKAVRAWVVLQKDVSGLALFYIGH
jgi:hypothetical protein